MMQASDSSFYGRSNPPLEPTAEELGGSAADR
jgi:hypothetical protein